MAIPILTEIGLGFKAITRIADVAKQVGDFYVSKQMQELGSLRQANEILQAENRELRARNEALSALMARPGSLSGNDKL